ncbi:MAG TPA: phosphotransferase [Vicinamibacterales bacterium]|jgi:aminoglycoside/choline kinase family phosphotransferase
MTLNAHPSAGPIPDSIKAYLARRGEDRAGTRVVPLTGDASDRRYFRLIDAAGSTSVLALYASPFQYDKLSFVNVAELLQQVPLPVPAIFDHADDLGLLRLQDLGDVTMQAHLGAASPGEHAALYRQAVGFIEILQRRGRELASPKYTPYSLAFDVEKLTWELEFFVKHFIEAYRGVQVPMATRDAIRGEWKPLVDELAAEPQVLCHRDYHSRNLMPHRGVLYVIDFQDARLGPDTYDLASFLRDSYVDFTEDTVDELIAFFLALRGQGEARADSGTQRSYQADFRRRFDLMSLQRNLKALGTFGYQTTTRQNTVYIQYMPRTLRNVRTNLQRYPRFGRLRDLLATFIEA